MNNFIGFLDNFILFRRDEQSRPIMVMYLDKEKFFQFDPDGIKFFITPLEQEKENAIKAFSENYDILSLYKEKNKLL